MRIEDFLRFWYMLPWRGLRSPCISPLCGDHPKAEVIKKKTGAPTCGPRGREDRRASYSLNT